VAKKVYSSFLVSGSGSVSAVVDVDVTVVVTMMVTVRRVSSKYCVLVSAGCGMTVHHEIPVTVTALDIWR
jgi:hypothetical protein